MLRSSDVMLTAFLVWSSRSSSQASITVPESLNYNRHLLYSSPYYDLDQLTVLAFDIAPPLFLLRAQVGRQVVLISRGKD